MTEGITVEMMEKAIKTMMDRKPNPFYVKLPNGSVIEPMYLPKADVVWDEERQQFKPNEDSWKKKLENRS